MSLPPLATRGHRCFTTTWTVPVCTSSIDEPRPLTFVKQTHRNNWSDVKDELPVWAKIRLLVVLLIGHMMPVLSRWWRWFSGVGVIWSIFDTPYSSVFVVNTRCICRHSHQPRLAVFCRCCLFSSPATNQYRDSVMYGKLIEGLTDGLNVSRNWTLNVSFIEAANFFWVVFNCSLKNV